jgi:hypothetical protein
VEGQYAAKIKHSPSENREIQRKTMASVQPHAGFHGEEGEAWTYYLIGLEFHVGSTFFHILFLFTKIYPTFIPYLGFVFSFPLFLLFSIDGYTFISQGRMGAACIIAWDIPANGAKSFFAIFEH